MMKDKIIKSKAVITADMLSSADTTIDELLSKAVCEAQIEQMAKIMCGHDCEECAKETAEWRGVSLEKAKAGQCLVKERAELLYNAGCRIIPEGSVVLSRENYERLVKTAQGKIGNMKVTDFLKACTSIGIMVEAVSTEEQVKHAYEKGSKETAANIFAKIDKELCECTIVFNGGDYAWKLQGYERTDLTKRLTKLANQFGTDIEKYKEKAYSDYLLLKNYYGHAKEQTEKVQADNESLYGNLAKFKEIVRKEAVEKILNEIDKELYDISRLYLECVEKNSKDDDIINNYGVMTLAHNIVVNVAKEYGVEIKGEK